jgi:hypothetical protein
MLERLRRFSVLHSDARGLFFRAAIALPLISLSLKFRGLRATLDSLQRSSSNPSEALQQSLHVSAPDIDPVQITARMVNAAARNAWTPSTCLEKSLTLWWLLRRRGLISELRIGARKINEKFEAHAWVERNGTAINEPQAAHRHYAPFDPTLSAMPLERQ